MFYRAEHYYVKLYVARVHIGNVNFNDSNDQILEFQPPPVVKIEELQTKAHDDNSTISIVLPEILNHILKN